MDFGFDSDSSKKKATVTSHLEKGDNYDHSPMFGDSPLHAADKMRKSTSGSGSTDDFEHVDHDPFMSDTGFPTTKAPAPGFGGAAAGGGDANKLLDFGSDIQFAVSGAKDKAADFMSSFGDKISMTRDFMAAERGGIEPPNPVPKIASQPDFGISAPLVDPQPVSKPVQESIFEPEPVHVEEVKQPSPVPLKQEEPTPAPVQEQPPTDNFSFFDSPVKKISKEDTEKFISSEDLLGDFSDARRTPEPALPVISKPEPAVPSAPLMTEPVPAPAPVIVAPVVEPPKPKEEPKPAPVPVIEDKPVPAAPPKVEEKVILAAVPEPVKAPEPVKPSTPTTSAPAKKSNKPMISAEEIFCRYGLDAWFKPDRLHPVVESLIYWRDVKKSGIVFGAGLVILLAISCFSVISVFAYLSLLSLGGAIAFRIYKNVLGAIQKTSEGHPFKEYLELDLNISQEKAQNVVSVVVAHFNGFISELRRLFLVDDLVDSIKFGVILWVLTYIGAWFNGMTLVILAFVALFTLPKVYENNKESIDTYLDLVRSKIMEITDKVKAAIPIGKKQETDKDK